MTPPNDDHVTSGMLAVGGEILESSVSLCIYADDIDIEAITNKLNCSPTKAHKRGDQEGRRSPAGIGLWLLQAPKSMLIPDAIKYLLESTTDNNDVWAALQLHHSMNLRIGVFLHSYNEGTDIPATLIAEIGRRRWAMGLDVYSAEGDEIIDGFLSKANS